MNSQVGTFFIVLGIFGLIVFFASVQADQSICSIGLISAASILLGMFFKSRKPRHPK